MSEGIVDVIPPNHVLGLVQQIIHPRAIRISPIHHLARLIERFGTLDNSAIRVSAPPLETGNAKKSFVKERKCAHCIQIDNGSSEWLIEAWASQKSFQKKDGRTDADAKLYKKGDGRKPE